MRAIQAIALDIVGHVLQAIDDSTDEISKCGSQIILELFQKTLEVKRILEESTNSCENAPYGPYLSDLTLLADEKLHVFPFKDVETCWRRLYTDANLLKAVTEALQPPGSNAIDQDLSTYYEDIIDPHDAWLDKIVKILDMVIIMTGAPGPDRHELIAELLATLEAKYDPFDPSNLDFELSYRFPSSVANVRNIQEPVQRVEAPSLSMFESYMLKPPNKDLGPAPLIITGALEHWPALKDDTWSSPSYLLSQTFSGRRLVPIETGHSYVSEGWGQKIIPFREYLEDYLLPPTESGPESTREMGYLAQHPLLTQLPSLRKDVTIPDYCFIDPPDPLRVSLTGQNKDLQTLKLEEPLINAWLGPAHTTSPLHHDPYHNFLCQVVGKKYIRLYSPLETSKVYPRGMEHGIDMSNTSQIDIGAVADGTDGALDGFTELINAKYSECVLEPGEMLYIPVGWWHYVHSLSTSFSVSFWWN